MTIDNLSRRTVLGLGACSAFAASGLAGAQARPVRLILPVSAGSGVDTIARSAAPALTRAFGTAVVVENMPGAGGVIGASTIAKATPDGYTLGFVSNNHVILPAVYKNMPFDVVSDFTPICVVGATPLMLVANPKLPVNNVRELIALLKANPDKYNYASSGNGTVIHLAGELLLDEADVKAKHIPYKGTGPMINDLIAGTVDFGVVGMSAARPHIQSGALRALGNGGATRSQADPTIPTIAEQGLPDYAIEGWFAFIGPAKMPEAVVHRVHEALAAAFTSREVSEALGKAGTVIKVGTPQQASAMFRSETARYLRLAKKSGITLL